MNLKVVDHHQGKGSRKVLLTIKDFPAAPNSLVSSSLVRQYLNCLHGEILKKVWSRPRGNSVTWIFVDCSEDCHQHHETFLDILLPLCKERWGNLIICNFVIFVISVSFFKARCMDIVVDRTAFIPAERKDDSANFYNSILKKSGSSIFYYYAV